MLYFALSRAVYTCSVSVTDQTLTLIHRISRQESHNPNSDVHFFTTHFMTTLKKDGPKAVASWTVKKNINIFEKKFIFIPIHADLHWSLCVVVNPGLIANFFNSDTALASEEHAW